MKLSPGNRASSSRQGVAVAAVLLAVMILALTVAGTVLPLAHEADLSAVRIETTRAFYAAESGASIVLSTTSAGLPTPRADDRVMIGAQSVVFLEVPDGPGDLVIEGRSGHAARRVRIQID